MTEAKAGSGVSDTRAALTRGPLRHRVPSPEVGAAEPSETAVPSAPLTKETYDECRSGEREPGD
jgi:hypothetical protein